MGESAGPDVAGPDVAGPDVAGPDVAGPDVAGPDVAGPDVAGPDVAGPDVAERAEAAVAAGDWDRAYALLTAADADGRLPPAALPMLGEVAYAAGHVDACVATWERVHTTALRAGDDTAAAGAAVRVALHLLFDSALMAPVRGWLARAERLIDGRDDEGSISVRGWLTVVRAYERMLSGDRAAARGHADRAVATAGDPAAAALGRVALARLLVLDGDVADGLALLDEAGVAAVSGGLDPLTTGAVYCELVCALQGLAQYDVAAEWTEAMERWSASSAIGSVHGRCRVHRSEVLRLRGASSEAEHEALAACEELRPYLRRERGWPLTELGRIRLQRADLAGAEDALLAAHRAGWEPQPALALLRLAQGDPAEAAAGLRDALERPAFLPSKERPPNSPLQRAPLLEAQVEAETATGGLERARAAAAELEATADRFGSRALRAGAALARGRVHLAEGDAGRAEVASAEAVRLWEEVGAPYEAARARLCLADACRSAGDERRADREEAAARAALADVAAGPAPSVPRPRAAAPGDSPRGDAGPDGAGEVFRREGDVWTVAFAGRTVRLRDRKGLHHLARLLAVPGRELHVLDLVAAEEGHAVPVGGGAPHDRRRAGLGDAGEVLDAQAVAAYRRRLVEIDDDLEQARAAGDGERAAQADAERDFLVRELAAAVGLGGRRRRVGSDSERARVAVTRSVRQALARLAEHHPELGEHLGATVRTGTYCTYVPDPRCPPPWRL